MNKPSFSLRTKVIALALEPAITLARLIALPLDDFEDILRAQYLSAYRERGLSIAQISRRIGKSQRTTASIAALATAMADATEHASARFTLRREILILLGSQRLSRPEVQRPLARKYGATQVREELSVLVDEGLVECSRTDGIEFFSVATSVAIFDGDGAEQKFAGAKHFMQGVTHALYARFFETDATLPTFVRAISFRADPAQLDQTAAALFSGLLEAATRLDAGAPAAGLPNPAADVDALFAFVSKSRNPLLTPRPAKAADA